MKIGFSTSVIQRGKTGVAQYVFALLRALLPHADKNEFNLFILEEDLPLFAFAKGKMNFIPVAEKFRTAVKNVLWHQAELPKLAEKLGLDVLHVPSYRRMLWRAPCPLVATIHDLAPFHITGKYDWKRMIYGRVIVKRLARRQAEIIAVSENTARDLEHFFGLGRDRVSVVWNGIDHRRFQPGETAAAKKSAAEKWKLDRPFFLFVSRLEHPGKNHVRLIEAFNQFKGQNPTGCSRSAAATGTARRRFTRRPKARRSRPTSAFSASSATPRCRGFTTPRMFLFIRRCLKASVFRRLRRWPAACRSSAPRAARCAKSWRTPR